MNAPFMRITGRERKRMHAIENVPRRLAVWTAIMHMQPAHAFRLVRSELRRQSLLLSMDDGRHPGHWPIVLGRTLESLRRSEGAGASSILNRLAHAALPTVKPTHRVNPQRRHTSGKTLCPPAGSIDPQGEASNAPRGHAAPRRHSQRPKNGA